jgi:Xaa-Pro dipeptidase
MAASCLWRSDRMARSESTAGMGPTEARKAGELMMLDASYYRNKVAQIQGQLAEEGLEGLLLLDTDNVCYATGFFHISTERPLAVYIPGEGDPALFLPLLELEQASNGWVDDIRTYFDYPGEEHPLTWMCGEIPVQKLGVDSASHSAFLRIQEEKEDVVLTDLVHEMRKRKDAEEIDLIIQAAAYADLAIKTAHDVITSEAGAGITEREVRDAIVDMIVSRMRSELKESVDGLRHPCGGTVHSGERAAFPHGLLSDRKLRTGDTVIVGFGVTVGGYHAESGCTFLLGEPSAEQRMWLDTVLATRELVKGEIQSGVTCSEVNRKGLQVIEEAGLGAYIRHRLGHGIGLQNHEPPWIESGDDTVLAPGMVVSNEPGIYVPGEGGIRIIDTFLVTEDGNRTLSQYLSGISGADCVIPV